MRDNVKDAPRSPHSNFPLSGSPPPSHARTPFCTLSPLVEFDGGVGLRECAEKGAKERQDGIQA